MLLPCNLTHIQELLVGEREGLPRATRGSVPCGHLGLCRRLWAVSLLAGCSAASWRGNGRAAKELEGCGLLGVRFFVLLSGLGLSGGGRGVPGWRCRVGAVLCQVPRS